MILKMEYDEQDAKGDQVSPLSTSLAEELDQLFGEYYASKNRFDYFEESGKGKFWSLCKRHGLEFSELLEEANDLGLFSDHLLGASAFIADFPCFSHPPFSEQGPYRNEQLMFVFDELYQQRLVPSDKELCMKFIPEFMSWSHIAECVKHQMSAELGNKMKDVFDDWKFEESFELNDFGSDAVRQFIADLQRKRKLSNKEVEHIHGVVERARKFEAGKDVEAMSYIFIPLPFATDTSVEMKIGFFGIYRAKCRS